MALFEQTPSRSGSRFGKLSSNMFFTRNTAKPKRVRHIEGILMHIEHEFFFYNDLFLIF